MKVCAAVLLFLLLTIILKKSVSKKVKLMTDTKQELIIEKALQRFAHFGIQKTTMNEIADDLAMSKPLVYYYFPDKTTLIIAVIERIISEYQGRLSLIFGQSKSISESLSSMLELRMEFLERYFMLHLEDNTEQSLCREDVKNSIIKIRANEIKLIAKQFDRAVQERELLLVDSNHTAELFINMLAGLAMWTMAEQKKQLIPDLASFKLLLNKQKELAEIFLRGISCPVLT